MILTIYVLNNNNLLYSSANKIESSTSNLPGRYLDIYIIYNFIVNRYKKDKSYVMIKKKFRML